MLSGQVSGVSIEKRSKLENELSEIKNDSTLSPWQLHKVMAINEIQLFRNWEANRHLDTLLMLTSNANKKLEIQNIIQLLNQQKSKKALRLLKNLEKE